MEEWAPQPQESGSLDPPRRRPPTAVGVATPPPPHRDRGPYPRQARFRRAARAFTGFLTTFAGAVLVGTLLPAPASLTIATGLSMLLVKWHVRRRRSRHLFLQERHA